jgi:hypothetical protein
LLLVILEGLVAISDGTENGFWFLAAINLVCYCSIGFAVLNIVVISVTSLRLRILEHVHAAPDGIHVDDIIEQFDDAQLFERRIERLIANGSIIERNDGLHVRRGFLLTLSKLLEGLRLFLGGV